MAIDSIRLLTDSAGALWRELRGFGNIEDLPLSDCFEDWIRKSPHLVALDQIEEQKLRRNYRRLRNLLAEIETLVQSRSRTLDLVCARAAEETLAPE